MIENNERSMFFNIIYPKEKMGFVVDTYKLYIFSKIINLTTC